MCTYTIILKKKDQRIENKTCVSAACICMCVDLIGIFNLFIVYYVFQIITHYRTIDRIRNVKIESELCFILR